MRRGRSNELISSFQPTRPCDTHLLCGEHGLHPYGCMAPRRLMADRNSCRVSSRLRKTPSIWLVTMVTLDLCTPRVVMHWCAASITTATPNGLSTPSRQE